MPFVQIHLLKGKSTSYVRAIADGVASALSETFDVAVKDRFQVIREYAPGELIYNDSFLDVERTDDIVLIHIIASDTRSVATKQAFYKALVERLIREPGLRPQDVQVILSPNKREDWSFGNGIASYVPALKTEA